MPLVNLGAPVGRFGKAPLGQPAGPTAKAHRASQVFDALEFTQLEEQPMRRPWIELRRVGLLESAHVAGEFDDHRLHAETDAEIRYALLAGIADRFDHAFDAAGAEAAGNENSIEVT